MILSMTGFGRSTITAGAHSYTVEIKSVNSKNFDLMSESACRPVAAIKIAARK